MRYDAEHKQKTREKVLKAAANAIRAEGSQGVAVAGVMAQAGLTHGGFYAHFKSRDELIAAGIGQMFEDARGRLDAPNKTARQRLTYYVNFYLSTAHRDTRTSGCPLPFLNADAPRLPQAARERFAAGVADLTAMLARDLAELGRAEPEAEAASLLSELVGALALSRADPDPERSALILERSHQAITRRLGLEAAQ